MRAIETHLGPNPLVRWKERYARWTRAVETSPISPSVLVRWKIEINFSRPNRHTLALIISLVVSSVFGVVSWVSCDWTWFSRSGALITITGVVTEYWDVITTRRADDMSFWRSQEVHAATRAAIFFMCIGTLIWGFGDLTGWIVGAC